MTAAAGRTAKNGAKKATTSGAVRSSFEGQRFGMNAGDLANRSRNVYKGRKA